MLLIEIKLSCRTNGLWIWRYLLNCYDFYFGETKKMERERMEKARKKAEKERAEREKADKVRIVSSFIILLKIELIFLCWN